MHPPAVPNFLVVGTGKAGTTSLYHYLGQHPDIYMSPVKEPCYFASEVRVENLETRHLKHVRRQSAALAGILNDGKPVNALGWLFSEWDDYLRLFQNATSQTAIGEASPVYLWSESAAARIASHLPNAKIVMILRDPAERAFSQYLHQLNTGLTHTTFRQHLARCMRYRGQKLSVYYPLLEIGMYYEQVRRYLAHFPRNHIRIYWYEEAWRDTDSLFADLFEFLGVDNTFRPDMSQKSLTRRAPRFPVLNYAAKGLEWTHQLYQAVPSALRAPIRKLLSDKPRNLALDRKDREYLVDFYRDDIEKLATLLNRDLSGWLA
jgi:hypothetical protein